MNDRKQQLQFTHLVLLALQGDISEEQSGVLTDTLNHDPEALLFYTDLMEIYTELSPLGSVRIPSISEPQPDRQAENFNELLNLLAADENTALAIDIPRPARPDPTPPPAEKPVNVQTANKNLWTIGLSLAALLVVIAYPKIMPYFETVPVATIINSIQAEYGDEQFSAGSRLSNRKDLYSLQTGFAEIEFDSGARVIIEAPAAFQLKSANTMVLRSGRLFAVVPRQASGFTVKTATATVVDLGTEFGLDTTSPRGTELYVFSGKTELVVPGADRGNRVEQLTVGQARRIDTITGRVESVPFEKYSFVRRINSKTHQIWKGRDIVSLADLVMGGSGFGTSGEMSLNYDMNTGERSPYRDGRYRPGPGRYVPAPSNPFLDGIFVPNGKGQVVSSEGHQFEECPDTSGLYYTEFCLEKNWTYAPASAGRYLQQRNLPYASEVIFMHADMGATFDLKAVRNRFPDRRICRFMASVGMVFAFGGSPIVGAADYAPANTEFDVWILADGRLRMKLLNVRWDDLRELDVPLEPKDRFLSIVVTDGGTVYTGENANHYDVCGVADPRFELEPLK